MTEKEKKIIEWLGHPLFTVKYVEDWLKRNDNVMVNAPAALTSVNVKGFYEAVKALAEKELPVSEYNVEFQSLNDGDIFQVYGSERLWCKVPQHREKPYVDAYNDGPGNVCSGSFCNAFCINMKKGDPLYMECASITKCKIIDLSFLSPEDYTLSHPNDWVLKNRDGCKVYSMKDERAAKETCDRLNYGKLKLKDLRGYEELKNKPVSMEMTKGLLMDVLKDLPDDAPVFVACNGECNYDFVSETPRKKTDTFAIIHDGKVFITDENAVKINEEGDTI